MESPGKPPSPTIEISSDEESSADSSRPDHQNVNSKVVGRPGPAYRKPVAKQVLSPPKSQSLTAVIELHGTAEHHRNVSKGEAENTSTENSTTPPKPSTNPTSPASQKKKIRSNSESAASHAPPSISPQATPQNMKVPQSQGGSSTQSHDSTNAAKSLALAGSQETESDHLETEGRSETTDDDLEEESDPTETPDAPEVANVPISVKSGQSDSTNLEEDRTEATDDEVEEESDSDEPHGGPQPSSAPASAMNEQDSSTHLKADTENETTDEELEEELDIRQADTEDETTDGELDEYSDAMQAQVDDQLLTQSFESSSSLKQQSRVSNVTKVPLPAVKDAGLLQNHGSGRPSLRRMNLEAQRTKEANLEAAKARGLEKAQKIRAGTKPAELLEENSEVASSSELSSTSSEYETDEDEPMVNARSKRSSADNAAESHSDLNNEDVEEMSQKLLAESDFNGPSFSRVSALKSLSKGPDRMFRPTSKLQQDGAKRDGKKSGKIGWAKLGRQFSASKHKSSG